LSKQDFITKEEDELQCHHLHKNEFENFAKKILLSYTEDM